MKVIDLLGYKIDREMKKLIAKQTIERFRITGPPRPPRLFGKIFTPPKGNQDDN